MRIRKLIVNISMLLVLCGFSVGAIGSDTEQIDVVNDTYESLVPFIESLKQIQEVYVDENKVKGKALIYGAIRGMLNSLDPYSQFLDPQEYKELQSETHGSFGGLGIEIGIRNDILTVISPIDGTPAEKAGIKAGDRIIKINAESTKDITILQAVRKLRGQKGTQITITISREGAAEPFDVTITRDIINIVSVWKHTLGDKIGYIKLRSFAEKTAADMDKAIIELQDKNAKAIILDLRNNPGGLLTSAVDVSNSFLPEGTLIVYTQGRMKTQSMRFNALRKMNICNLPVVVLVNKGSASASEIVTGAIKDNKRGIIIGEKTFGKGSVQTIYNLSDESGVKITTAYYYTPSGECIHDKGINPDVAVEEKDPSSVTWNMKYKEYFIKYAKKYTKGNQNLDVNSLKNISDDMMNDFIGFVRNDKFEINDDIVSKDKNWIKKFIRMEIYRELKGDDLADVAELEDDLVVQKAMDILNNEISKTSAGQK